VTDPPVTVSDRPQLHSEWAVELRSLVERGRTAHGTTGDPVFYRPIGLQLTGKLGDDGLVLQVAECASR
jgi:hypothetical protein